MKWYARIGREELKGERGREEKEERILSSNTKGREREEKWEKNMRSYIMWRRRETRRREVLGRGWDGVWTLKRE